MKTARKAAGSLALAALIAGAGATAAQDREQRWREGFAAADKNADGVLDVDEYVGHTVNNFAIIDVDRNKVVVIEDVPEVNPARFASADRNGDGAVSLGEAVAERMIIFFDIDTNEDGVISLDEVLVFEKTQP